MQIEEENELPHPFAGPIDSDPPVVQPTLARPIRAIGRLETDDLTAPWPDDEIRTVLCADQDDPPGSDIYHAGVYPYPYAADAYFMFPLTYHHFTEAESPVVRNDGVNDCQFCASRDGIHWMRYDRRPYIGRGIQGEFDGGGIHGSPYLIRRGAELYQHYGGEPWTHGQYRRLSDQERRDRANWARGRSCVAVQRLDGFVSANAAYTGGTLLTPPLTFDGDRLELNIDVAAMGEARVELRDREGRPIDGFGAGDCDRLTCNDVAARVRWARQRGPRRTARPAGPAARAHALGEAVRLSVRDRLILRWCRGSPPLRRIHRLELFLDYALDAVELLCMVEQRSEMPHPGLLVAAVPQQPQPDRRWRHRRMRAGVWPRAAAVAFASRSRWSGNSTVVFIATQPTRKYGRRAAVTK